MVSKRRRGFSTSLGQFCHEMREITQHAKLLEEDANVAKQYAIDKASWDALEKIRVDLQRAGVGASILAKRAGCGR